MNQIRCIADPEFRQQWTIKFDQRLPIVVIGEGKGSKDRTELIEFYHRIGVQSSVLDANARVAILKNVK